MIMRKGRIFMGTIIKVWAAVMFNLFIYLFIHSYFTSWHNLWARVRRNHLWNHRYNWGWISLFFAVCRLKNDTATWELFKARKHNLAIPNLMQECHDCYAECSTAMPINPTLLVDLPMSLNPVCKKNAMNLCCAILDTFQTSEQNHTPGAIKITQHDSQLAKRIIYLASQLLVW